MHGRDQAAPHLLYKSNPEIRPPLYHCPKGLHLTSVYLPTTHLLLCELSFEAMFSVWMQALNGVRIPARHLGAETQCWNLTSSANQPPKLIIDLAVNDSGLGDLTVINHPTNQEPIYEMNARPRDN